MAEQPQYNTYNKTLSIFTVQPTQSVVQDLLENGDESGKKLVTCRHNSALSNISNRNLSIFSINSEFIGTLEAIYQDDDDLSHTVLDNSHNITSTNKNTVNPEDDISFQNKDVTKKKTIKDVQSLRILKAL